MGNRCPTSGTLLKDTDSSASSTAWARSALSAATSAAASAAALRRPSVRAEVARRHSSGHDALTLRLCGAVGVSLAGAAIASRSQAAIYLRSAVYP